MFNFSICFLKNSIKAALVQGLLAQNVKRKSKKYSIYSMSAFQKVPRNDIFTKYFTKYLPVLSLLATNNEPLTMRGGWSG